MQQLKQDAFEQNKQVIIASVSQYQSDNLTSYKSKFQDDSTNGPVILITTMACNAFWEKICAGTAFSHNLKTGEQKMSYIFGYEAVK